MPQGLIHIAALIGDNYVLHNMAASRGSSERVTQVNSWLPPLEAALLLV